MAAGVNGSGSLWCFAKVTLSFFGFNKKANAQTETGAEAQTCVQPLIISVVFGWWIKLLGQIDAVHNQPPNRDQTSVGVC